MTALILGGAASGKSEYGERLALSLPRRGELLYLATMEPFGGEAEARIRRHRALRAGKGFQTWERPKNRAEHLIVVSCDLHRDGEGYPPETAAYLDLTARLHRALAAQGDLVAEVVCGLPVIWKGETA